MLLVDMQWIKLLSLLFHKILDCWNYFRRLYLTFSAPLSEWEMVKEGNIVVSSNEWSPCSVYCQRGVLVCEACEAASWLLLNPNNNNQNSSPFLFGADVDHYLDLMDSSHNNDYAVQHFHSSSYPYIHHSSLPQNVCLLSFIIFH